MTLVIAHRGASSLHPPGNTLEAFAAAGELGADGVELDVHALGDGALGVHHDPTLPDGRALHELRSEDLPAWVPLLEASLFRCEPLDVNVEIKGDGPMALRASLVADTVDLLVRLGSPDRFLITSFDWEIITAARQRAPQVPTGFLTMNDPMVDGLLDRIAAAGHCAVNPWNGVVTPVVVAAAHELGLSVNVWTVDDPARIRELAAMGVDAIITNVPDRCRAVLSEG
jgi:glycerophosphoryl diester phosphodiesterase